MWKFGKEDTEIEQLLSRYRPAEPRSDLWNQISTFPNSHISKSARAWPWAVAAAALLAITVGLHATVVQPPPDSPVPDARRVELLAEELGGSREGQAVAEWLVIGEARAEHDRLARVAALAQGRQ